MKSILSVRVAIVAALALGVLLSPAARAQNTSNIRVVRLSRADGQVLVSHAGSNTWEAASVNLPLREGDRLATQDGRAEIEFENGDTTYLAENSVLEFTHVGFSNGGRATELTLTQGAGTFDASLASNDSFRVHTLTFDVTVPERAEFRIDGFLDGASAEVLSGNVSVSTPKGSTDLDKGQSVAVRQKDFQDLYRGRLANPDPFDRWVVEEGERIRASNKNTLSFINSQNYYGLSELSIYGTWINFAEFGGFIWRPFGIGVSWTPFQNGVWRFDPLLGWIWVSSEQWGWMPYHFGSWLLSPVLGWVWVPGGPAGLSQWQGARVNWVSVGNQVGWVAISPNDRDGVPANAAHGVITTSSQSPKNGIEQNQIVSGKDLRNVTPLKQPPQELASGPATGSVGLGTRSTIRIVPRTRYADGPVGPDDQPKAVFNGINPPVAPAISMPQSNTEVPRVTQSLPATADSQMNRDFAPSPYLPSSTGSGPASGAIHAKPPGSIPTSIAQPHPIAPPAIPRPAAPQSAPAQPSAQHSAPAAPAPKNPEAHPATKAVQPASPQAPTR